MTLFCGDWLKLDIEVLQGGDASLGMFQDRGLADLVADNPPTIMLKFEHKVADQLNSNDDFYTHSKENR